MQARMDGCPLLLLLMVSSIALVCQADNDSTTELRLPEDSTQIPPIIETTTRTNSIELEGASEADARPRLGFFASPLERIRSGFIRARELFASPELSLSDSVEEVRLRTFKQFMRIYNKTYSPEEIPKRVAVFFRRRQEIAQSVKMFSEGKSSYVMRENAFTDLYDDELRKLTGLAPHSHTLARRLVGGENDLEIGDDDDDWLNLTALANAPESRDWRASGCIETPIHQLKCGACYAIVSMSLLESMRCINGVPTPALSPQQIIDCSAAYETYGCRGGYTLNVFKYLRDTGVAATEECYPFVRRQEACRLEQVQTRAGCTVAASPTSSPLRYRLLGNEQDVFKHVATRGPVLSAIKTTNSFYFYSNGIHDDPSCSRLSQDAGHAIVVVGYGRENGVDYWTIKNSWGTDWGLGGFARIRRGVNACSFGHWALVIS